MPETPDISTIVYARIWELWLASPVWAAAFPPGNRIRYDIPIGPNNPAKPKSIDGDVPSAKLKVIGGIVNMFTTDEVFATHSDTPPAHWIEESTFRFKATLVSQRVSSKEVDRLGALSINALRKSGPKLGIPQVVRWRASWDTKETREVDEENEDDMIRYQTDMIIIVETQCDGATLLGD